MAKSMRSKREKRLRAIRRELVEPIYEKKDEAKQAALEAALSAPKLPVRTSSSSMAAMEVEMGDGGEKQSSMMDYSLKPAGGVGKKSSSSSSSSSKKRKGFKVGKNKRRGKWKPGRKQHI